MIEIRQTQASLPTPFTLFARKKITLITSELRWLSRKSSRVRLGRGIYFSSSLSVLTLAPKIFLHASIIGIPYFFCLFKSAHHRMYTRLSCSTAHRSYFSPSVLLTIFLFLLLTTFATHSLDFFLLFCFSNCDEFISFSRTTSGPYAAQRRARIAKNLLNLPERTRVSLKSELARSVFQLLPISCQTKLRTEELC